MDRSFHLVDYATTMTWDCPPLIDFNHQFVMAARIGSSPRTAFQIYNNAFRVFDFTLNNNPDIFIQKFEELNPIYNHDAFHYTIYPNIRFAIPNGFRLKIDSLIPGIEVNHYKCLRKKGRNYDYVNNEDDIISFIDLRGKQQEVKLLGGYNLYKMYHIQEISFILKDSSYVECTPTGIRILRDMYPTTDILKIEFECLHKDLPENYEDRPNFEPLGGCMNAYNQFIVIRNPTLYNYIYW